MTFLKMFVLQTGVNWIAFPAISLSGQSEETNAETTDIKQEEAAKYCHLTVSNSDNG